MVYIVGIHLGKKSDSKDKEKADRTDDSGPASTPNQQLQQPSSTTPTNFVSKIFFKILNLKSNDG
jgi:hypothetical protein